MDAPLRLMCIFAHPDDESLGTGGVLARYAAEGVETYLVTATRGERGWFGPPGENPGPAALGRIREVELADAAGVLGIRSVRLLDYVDGDLDKADVREAIGRIVEHLRRVRPQVVITFGPEGAYGHPDHIAISQFTTAALVCAADPSFAPSSEFMPHMVSKLYYMVNTAEELEAYQEIFGELIMDIDGVQRRAASWPAWAVTTRVDVVPYLHVAREAVSCHRSQLPGYESILKLSDERLRFMWGSAAFYRAYSIVNSGRQMERDLFEGLR